MTEIFGPLGGWLHTVFVEQFDAWILLGFVAQALFTMRFIVQWVASERAKRSVVPVAFWFFSLGGGALLFVYAIVRAGSGVHPRPGHGAVHLHPQSLADRQRAQSRERNELRPPMASVPGKADPFISIVIPAKNEGENLGWVLAELETALAGRRFEVIVVDDGSTDDTRAVLAGERKRRSFPVRHLRHDRSTGKSLALRTGAFAAKGELVATLDGDGQNNPVHILELADKLLAAGPQTGIAVGQRLKRGDSSVKKYASRFANGLRSRVLADNTRDTACGLKVVRTEVFRRLPFFEGSHRFLPALVLTEGYGVVHSDVVDRPRQHGKSHYGILDRGLQGALDLFGVWWFRRRRRINPKVEELGDD